MLFETMHPFLEGIGQEKLCDVFGRAVDFLQKIQDETLDQDLLHSLQDTPDAARNRLIAELFGFPTGQQFEKECCSGKKSCGPKKSTESAPKSEPAANLYPNRDLEQVASEFLKQQSGSSKETLNDIAARVFGRIGAPIPETETAKTSPEEPKLNDPVGEIQAPTETKTEATAPKETETTSSEPTEESVLEQGPEESTPGTSMPDKTTTEFPRNYDIYEWRFPAADWCGPNDAAVTVTDSTIQLKVQKEETNLENNVTTRKTLDFSVALPDDAVVDQMAACFSEASSEFILNVPKKKARVENSARAVPINFIQA